VTRVRLTFSKERALRYIGHLDVVRMWERAFRRAKLPLAYTLGFTPHPRLTLAAPLALGVTSEAELMDVYLREPLTADEVAARIAAQLPAGCRVVAAAALPVEGAALTAQTRWAQYRVLASAGGGPAQGVAEGLGSRWAGGAPTNRDGGMASARAATGAARAGAAAAAGGRDGGTDR
jgi:radical SAM-linked protein